MKQTGKTFGSEKKRAAGKTVWLASLVVLCCVLLTAPACTHLFFKPGRHFVNDPATLAYDPQDIYFRSGDGLLLHGWYLRGRGEELGTVLICHGNVENVSTHVKLDLWLIDAGYNLFIFDYRGYGRSEGSPDVAGIQKDAESALDTLLTLPKNSDDGIIVFGKSLGGAVAVHLVANTRNKDRVRALILDSAFSSYRAIAREKIAGSVIGWPVQYPLSVLVNDEYSPVDFIAGVSPVPVLIMHARNDAIVPEHHSRILYEAARQPKDLWELPVTGHVKSWTHEPTRMKLLTYLAGIPKIHRRPSGR